MGLSRVWRYVRRGKCKFAHAIAVFIALSHSALAQLGTAPAPHHIPEVKGGPSLSETSRWLSEAIAAGMSGNRSDSDKVYWDETAAVFNGCNLILIKKRWEVGQANDFVPAKNASAKRDFLPKAVGLTQVALADLDTNIVVSEQGSSSTIRFLGQPGNNPSSALLYLDSVGKATKIVEGNVSVGLAKADTTDEGVLARYRSVDAVLASGDLNTSLCAESRCAALSSTGLLFNDYSLAFRVVTALKHAVGLCQALEQDRRQSEAASVKKKELF